ncbi:hypothetical protein WDW86_05670 [Bdellovibrionota bacterium FG-2]
MATGGGLSKRKHYSDDEEVVLDAKRPIILNGIDEFVARGDLASRTITLQLPSISEEGRKCEATFWSKFEELRPKILGVIFNAISEALKNRGTFELKEKPRMADAWYWISAAETSFGWKRGTTIKAFQANQVKANEIVLNSSNIASFICQLSTVGWSGTPTDLLSKLNAMRGVPSDFDRYWPKTAKSLTDRIRRLSPALKSAGVDVSFSRTSGSGSERNVRIRKIDDFCDALDASTQDQLKRDEGDAEEWKSIL